MMTKATYDKIKEQIRELEDEKPKVIQAISDARDLGDLSENAEYHSARERLSHIEAKISQLAGQINNSEIVNDKDINTEVVNFGTSVKLYDFKFEEEIEVTIVAPGEADPNKNEISINSPMAKGLLGKKVGETAIVKLPMGEVSYEIRKIFVK